MIARRELLAMSREKKRRRERRQTTKRTTYTEIARDAEAAEKSYLMRTSPREERRGSGKRRAMCAGEG